MPKGLQGFQKGNPSGNMKGKKHSEETKLKMSVAHKGQIAWNKDKRGTYNHSEKAKVRIGLSRKGKKWSEYLKNKMSENRKGKSSGKNHPNWRGGLSHVQKLELKAGRKKPDQCELCGREGKICFDHDHKTGKFRGWICNKCNSALGFMDDNVQTLELMIEYIKKHRREL